MMARIALMWLLMGIALLVFVIVMGAYTMGRVDSMATVDTQYVSYSEAKELYADAVRVMWMALGLGVVAGFFITRGVMALLRR